MTHSEWQDRVLSLARNLDLAISELEGYDERFPNGQHRYAYQYEVNCILALLRTRIREEPGVKAA